MVGDARIRREAGSVVGVRSGTCKFNCCAVQDFPKSPIHYQHFAVTTNHHVFRLEIAMNYASGVRKCYWLRNTQQQANAVGNCRHFRQTVVETLAFHVLHAIENSSVRKSPSVMDWNDAWMLERSENVGFAGKA